MNRPPEHLLDHASPDGLREWATTLVDAGDNAGEMILSALDDQNATQVAKARRVSTGRWKANITWKNGVVDSVKKCHSPRGGNSAIPMLEGLLQSTVGGLVRRLELNHNGQRCNYKTVFAKLVELGAPSLRALQMVHEGATGFNGLKGLAAAAPRLEDLRLAGNFTDAALKGLAGPLPHLRVLHLDFHGTPVWKKAPKIKAYTTLLTTAGLPALSHLRLERTGATDALLDHLLASGLLARMESLWLGGFFTEEGVTRFLEGTPQTCNVVITRHAPTDDWQRVEDVTHRCATPELEAEYQSLWEPTPAEPWWESDALPFHNTTLRRGAPPWQNILLWTERDGLAHGRFTRCQRERSDEPHWFGVQHGLRISSNRDGSPNNMRFVGGLRNGRKEQRAEDGSVARVQRYELGRCVDTIVPNESDDARAARQLHQRLGSEFRLNGTDWYSLKASIKLDDALAALPAVAQAIQRADDGVTVRPMKTHRDEALHAVVWHAGDTLCGLIVDGTSIVASIEDSEICAP